MLRFQIRLKLNKELSVRAGVNTDLLWNKGEKVEIGIDCVDIARFAKDMVSKQNILRKIFTENEIHYCEKKYNKSKHYAVRFAGKEAVVKALSCYDIRVSLNQIEILNTKNQVPFVRLLDEQLGDFEIKISLSHSGEIAMAVAIVFKNPIM